MQLILQKPFWRRNGMVLFCLASTLFALVWNGYSFGVQDQKVHLPYLKQMLNPALYPNDPFVLLRNTKPTYFWSLLLPLFRMFGIEWVFFGLFVVALFFFFTQIYGLAMDMFGRRAIAIMAVLALMLPKFSFGFVSTLDALMLPRMVVLPLLLLSIRLYLRPKTVLAFLLVGLVANLHWMSAMFVLAMFATDVALGGRRDLGKKLLGLVVAVLVCLPTLLWRSGVSQGIDFGVHPSWFAFMRVVQDGFYQFLQMTNPQILITLLAGFASMAMVVFAWRKLGWPDLGHKQIMRNFVVALLVLSLLAVLVAHVLPITVLVQLQVIRANTFLLLLTYILLAAYGFQLYEQKSLLRWWLAISVFVLWASVWPFLTMLVLLFGLWVKDKPRLHWFYATLAGVGFVAMMVSMWVAQTWWPGVRIWPEHNDLWATEDWIRQHTPQDAKLIVPPYQSGLHVPDFRAIAERSVVMTAGDPSEAAFNVDWAVPVTQKWNDLTGGAFQKVLNRGEAGLYSSSLHGGFFKTAYAANRVVDFVMIAKKYGASLVVVEADTQLVLPLVYANAGYRVYDLRPLL